MARRTSRSKSEKIRITRRWTRAVLVILVIHVFARNMLLYNCLPPSSALVPRVLHAAGVDLCTVFCTAFAFLTRLRKISGRCGLLGACGNGIGILALFLFDTERIGTPGPFPLPLGWWFGRLRTGRKLLRFRR